MNLEEAKKLFERRKYSYTSGILPSNKPVAYILGGQPSSGKSSLSNFYQDELNTLVINGDLYRGLHPNYNELVAQPLTYSRETQLLSNVFTEGLIDEAILNRVSVSVEGTMRRSEVVEATIDKFKDADFFVELLCIAAPKEYTAINLYYRYANELVLKGEGRLADIKSHNEAYEGILSTLDQAFYSKKADRIRLYEIFGRRQIIDYQKKGEQWSIQELPSSIVKKSRYSQLLDTSLALRMVEKGVEALFVIQEKDLRKDLQDKLQELIELLKSHTYENATLYQENIQLLDEIDRLTYGVNEFKSLGLDTLWQECKLYNEADAFFSHRKQFKELTISQAFIMALDNIPITAGSMRLHAELDQGQYHLKINEQRVIDLQNDFLQANEKSKGLKR